MPWPTPRTFPLERPRVEAVILENLTEGAPARSLCAMAGCVVSSDIDASARVGKRGRQQATPKVGSAYDSAQSGLRRDLSAESYRGTGLAARAGWWYHDTCNARGGLSRNLSEHVSFVGVIS